LTKACRDVGARRFRDRLVPLEGCSKNLASGFGARSGGTGVCRFLSRLKPLLQERAMRLL